MLPAKNAGCCVRTLLNAIVGVGMQSQMRRECSF